MPDFLLRKDSGELEFVTGTEPFVVTLGSGPGSYEVYRLDNSASVILQGAGDTQAPSIEGFSAVVVNNQATLNWTSDEANGTTYWVCTNSETVPNSTQIIAGQDHTGAVAEASGAQPVTATGAQSTDPVDGLLDGEIYSFHLMQRDASGNTSATLTSMVTVPLPSAAPALSGLVTSADGTNATLSYATSEGSGGMYWVLTASASVPESWRIRRAEDHSGNPALADGNQRPSIAGVQPDIVVTDLTPGETYHFHLYHRANGETSDVASVSVTLESQSSGDTTAPVLSGVSDSLDGTTATLSWSSDEGNGNGYWVCTTSSTRPSVAQIIAGQDHTGSTAFASGIQAVSAPGVQADQMVPGLISGPTYFFHLLQQDASGNTSTRYSTAGVAVPPPSDTTAPVLSNVSAALSGNTATLSWSSDEGNGDGYWVCTTSSVQPSVTQIIAGQNHTGISAFSSGTQAVSSAGAQADQVVPGLVSGPTYFFHLIHQDASGNTSARVSTTGVTVASSEVSAQINILHRSVTEAAPEAIVFDLSLAGFDTSSASAGEVYNPQLHDLHYYWDFGDSYNFQAPEKLIEQFRNAGTAYGPKVSHVYRTPGTYFVSCLIVEPSSGKSTTAQMSVTVGDEDALYPGTQTVMVDATGAGTGAPSGATVVTTLDAAFSDVFNGPSGTARRIIIKRNQTFTPYSLQIMGQTANRINALIRAEHAPGAKPVIDTQFANMTWGNADGATIDCELKIQNIEFVGPWDPTTQSGSQQTLLLTYENRPKQLLMDGCVVRGYDGAIYPIFWDRVVTPDPYIIVNDTVVTDYRSACLFGDGNWVLTGNRLAQNPEALNGYAGASNNLISCVRFGYSPNIICAHNDFFSRTGWFVNVPGIYTAQSCFRGNTSSLRGAFYNVNCNMMEGGVGTFSIDISDTDTSHAINGIVEKNITVGYHDSYRSMEFGYGGITIRNNICIIPNAPRFGVPLNGFVALKRRTAGSDDAENRDAPIKLYNNTFVCLTDTDNVSGGPVSIYDNEGYTTVIEQNNVNHQPNRGLIVSNLDNTVLWAPRYTHYEDDDTPRDTTRATPTDTIALYAPLIGSDVLGEALNGQVAHDDFFGNARPQYPSRGALEAL